MLQYKVERYTGRKIGKSNFLERVGVQIVCTDETGKRRAVFRARRSDGRQGGKTPCLKVAEFASHYKTGMNKADAAKYAEAWKEAEKQAAKLNKKEAKKS